MKFKKYIFVIVIFIGLGLCIQKDDDRKQFNYGWLLIPLATQVAIDRTGRSKKNYIIFMDSADVPIFYLKELFPCDWRVRIEDLKMRLMAKIKEILVERYPEYRIDIIDRQFTPVQRQQLRRQKVQVVKLEFLTDNWQSRWRLMMYRLLHLNRVALVSAGRQHRLEDFL